MSALTTRLPRKSSRTSTQAIRVPVTTLTATTASDTYNVSFSAAQASGALTASQNAPAPPSSERTTTAASGTSTIRLNHATASAPGGAASPMGRRGARAGSGRAAESAGGDTEPPLDLGHLARGGDEELVVDRAPPAELVAREQLRRVGELARVGHRLGHRAIALGDEDPLGRGRAHEVDERLRGLGVLGVLGHRDGVLDQDRLVGDD